MSEEATQDTGSQEVAAEAPVSFVDSLDENLRSNPSLKNFTDANALAKSYVHARSMIGADTVVKPQSNWTDEQYDQFYMDTGRPETSADYDLKINVDESDEDSWNKFKDAVHGAGLNNRQAQQMADFLETTITEVDERSAQNVEFINSQTEMELEKEFGQATKQKIETAMAAAERYIDPELLDNVFLSDGRRLGDHPDIIRMFAAIASDIGEDSLVGEGTELVMTPDEAMSLAKQKMTEGAYTDKFHPNHDEAVQEVRRLFGLASG